MQQLLLNLDTVSVPTLETFVPGQNAEVLHLFRQMATGNPRDRFVYIWGDAAVGKTHLLRAMSQLCAARLLAPSSSVTEFAWAPDTVLYLVDDCDRLSGEQQIAAFNLFNQPLRKIF